MRFMLLFLAFMAAPGPLQTGGGPKDSPAVNHNISYGWDRPDQGGGIKLWISAQPTGIDSAAFQYVLPDSETWLPESPTYAAVDTNGIISLSLDTVDSLWGEYSVRVLLKDYVASTSGFAVGIPPVMTLPIDTDSVNVFSLSGYAIQDSTLTITGRRFGVKETAAPLLWETFDDRTAGVLMKNIPGWYSMSPNDSTLGEWPRVDDVIGYGGSDKSAKFTFHRVNNSSTHSIADYRDTTFDDADTYYASFLYRPDFTQAWDASGAGRQVKVARWVSSPSTEDAYGVTNYPDLPFYFYSYAGDVNFNNGQLTARRSGSENCASLVQLTNVYFSGWDDPISSASVSASSACPQQQWSRFQMSAYMGTDDTADGWHQMWIRRYTSVRRAVQWRSSANECKGFKSMRLGEFIGNAEEAHGTAWFDDVYIDTTMARVEIGNSGTWNTCTAREIQIPTAWAPTSITVSVNTGALRRGQRAYLYVIRADGIVSNMGYGVPLWIGARMVPKDDDAGGYDPTEFPQFNE